MNKLKKRLLDIKDVMKANEIDGITLSLYFKYDELVEFLDEMKGENKAREESSMWVIISKEEVPYNAGSSVDFDYYYEIENRMTGEIKRIDRDDWWMYSKL